MVVVIKATDAFTPTLAKYEQGIGKASQATKQANESNRALAGSFDGLKTAITGTIAAIGFQQVVGFAEDMNQLGVQVRANETLFNRLTETIGGHEEVLANLRQTTGNVVDDLTLMSSASQLLRLNIVDNNRDLGELVGNIQKLKDPTESTTDAIHNFALMLSNESLLRLDSFGISSANVKRRMDELGQSFREAVMSEMDTQVARLGDAANVAETALARLQTKIQNLGQQLAEGFATGVDAAINFGEVVMNLNTQQVDAVNELADVSIQMFHRQIGQLTEDEAAQVHAAVESMHRSAADLKALGTAGQQYIQSLFGGVEEAQRIQERTASRQAQFLSLLGLPAGADITLESQFDVSHITDQLNALKAMGGDTIGTTTLFTPEQAAEAKEFAFYTANAVDQMKKLQDGNFDIPQSMVDGMKSVADDAKKFADAAEKGADAYLRMSEAQALGLDRSNVLGTDLAEQFLRAAEAEGMAADKLKEYRDELDLTFGNQTKFSQALEDYQHQLAASGAAPEEVATALDNLQQSLRLIKEQGLSTDLLQPANIPFLAGQLPGAEGQTITIEAGDNLYTLVEKFGGDIDQYRSLLDANGYLQPGKQSLGTQQFNVAFDAQAAINAMLPYIVQSNAGNLGGQFQIPPDLTRLPTPFGGSLGTGIGQFTMPDTDSTVQAFADMQDSSADLFDNTTLVAANLTDITSEAANTQTSFQDISTQSAAVVDAIGEWGDLLKTVFSHKYSLDVIAPDWFKALVLGMGGTDFAGAMATATKANGGTPPGQSPAGRSTRVVDR